MYPIVINEAKLQIYAWTDVENIEESAMQQAKNAANHPFAFHHVALMPDVHSGYGLPVGGVAAFENVVIPYAVGLDIGCGMRACKTSLTEIDHDVLQQIVDRIKELVPVGFAHRATPNESRLPVMERKFFEQSAIVKAEWDSAAYQMGSLGGGNHFLEIQKGSDGFIYIMLHSGSRNVGNKTGKHYSDLAKELNEEWSWDMYFDLKSNLCFLPLQGKNKKYGEAYMREMQWCLDFAFASRQFMMELSQQAFTEVFPNVYFEPSLDVHHNYVAWENHFGKNVLVHRKGATSAKAKQLGIIPGSQGTPSHIVEGLGNADSYTSCSHGAGRALSRSEAKKQLDFEAEVAKLNAKGIIHSIKSKCDLEEASGAYKDIEAVMIYQKNLVSSVVQLEPLAVVKDESKESKEEE